MTRKKEVMELENPAMEGNTPLDGTDTEAGASPAEGDSALTETDGDGMDLNELLGSMDQEASAEPETELGMLPELTEDEIFGEMPEDMDGSDAVHGTDEDAGGSDEAQPGSVSAPETEIPTAKGRRATRRKKEESSDKADGETQKMETEMPGPSETVSDDAPHSPDASVIPDTDGPAEHAADGAAYRF